jgi:DnaJ-class molecular chaperone
VTDHFAVFGIARSPWLDADALKDRFHRLSAQHHPDAPDGSGSAFTEINAAWQTLREPAKCLRHFLELEHPGSLATAGQPAPELADLFMKIAAFRDAAQRFTSRRASASTPLTRALLEPERIALQSRLEDLTADVTHRTGELVAGVRGGEATPEYLATSLTSLVFLEKWSAHLAEARLTL